MVDLAQLDLRAKGGEARIRALLEDLIGHYRGLYPGYQLALAVWFKKSLESDEQNVLALFNGPPIKPLLSALLTTGVSRRQSLLWKSGSEDPPYVNVYADSVDHFSQQLASNRDALAHFLETPEVLFFDKERLTPEIIQVFNVVTEPPGLSKGWYVGFDPNINSQKVRSLLASRTHTRPEIGIVKTWESPDFETCRALVHVEINQRWLPSSPGGIVLFSYYADWEDGHPGYFLLQGGALYQILKFEFKYAPDYAGLVLEKLRDDRYPEVYLRAVLPPKKSAA